MTDVEREARALEGSIRQTGHLLRRLALSCEFIAVRLGDELCDSASLEAPERLVPYRVQGLSTN